MKIKRFKSLIYLANLIPNTTIFCSGLLKSYYQTQLNRWLTTSMERFDYPVFKLALCLGADPNIDAKIKQGYHLVARAARSGEGMFLNALLAFGGDAHANLSPGEYFPIHLAATKGMENSIEILVKYGADIHAVYQLDESGWSPLICACIHNKTLAGKKLLDLGANPFDTNELGVSARDICLKLKNDELADYILEKQLILQK